MRICLSKTLIVSTILFLSSAYAHSSDIFSHLSDENYHEVKNAINNEADVNARDKNGETLLHHSIYHFAPIELIKFLLDNGADVNARDKNGATPLHYATLREFKVLKLLIDNGADVNARDKKYGLTPAHTTFLKKHNNDNLKLLIDKGADLTAEDKDGLTPFRVALKHGYSVPEITEITEMLINKMKTDIDIYKNEESPFDLYPQDLQKPKNPSVSNFLKKCSNVVLSLKNTKK